MIVGLALKIKPNGSGEDEQKGMDEVFRGIASEVLNMLENEGAESL